MYLGGDVRNPRVDSIRIGTDEVAQLREVVRACQKNSWEPDLDDLLDKLERLSQGGKGGALASLAELEEAQERLEKIVKQEQERAEEAERSLLEICQRLAVVRPPNAGPTLTAEGAKQVAIPMVVALHRRYDGLRSLLGDVHVALGSLHKKVETEGQPLALGTPADPPIAWGVEPVPREELVGEVALLRAELAAREEELLGVRQSWAEQERHLGDRLELRTVERDEYKRRWEVGTGERNALAATLKDASQRGDALKQELTGVYVRLDEVRGLLEEKTKQLMEKDAALGGIKALLEQYVGKPLEEWGG